MFPPGGQGFKTRAELAAETFPARSCRSDLGFARHIVHFAEQIPRSVGLAYEAVVIRNFRLSGRYLAGSDDQEDSGPTSVNLSLGPYRHIEPGIECR